MKLKRNELPRILYPDKDRKRRITDTEMEALIDRILLEAETQAKYNGVDFVGLSSEGICQKLTERIGTNWELVKDTSLENDKEE